jgi:hypothetical protein
MSFGIMRSKDATAPARVSAANAILDRGWGKAPQAIQNGDDGELELIHKIESVVRGERFGKIPFLW